MTTPDEPGAAPAPESARTDAAEPAAELSPEEAAAPEGAAAPPREAAPPAEGAAPSAEAASGSGAAQTPSESASVAPVPVAAAPATKQRRPRTLRRTIDRGIRILIVANILLVAALVAVLFIDVFRSSTPGHPAQAVASPSSSPVELMQMGLAHIPTSNACILCHDYGGSAGLKPIPAIGHPLEGWRQCLTCHTNDKLGRAAPGHEGIAETECTNCHRVAQAGPAITQPHSKLQDKKCLDCHGTFAHLPSSMAGRNEDECGVCHKPTPLPPPEFPHQASARLGCRECHQSPQVGNLPIDHALRTDSTCLLCHDIKIASGGPGPSIGPDASGAPLPPVSPPPSAAPPLASALPSPVGSPLPSLPVPTLPAPTLPAPTNPAPAVPTPGPSRTGG
jgi:hypothetical protein